MEENLVNKAKTGNKDAFEELIIMYQKKLYIIARSKIEKEEDVKDVIQESLLQAYIKINSLKNASSFNGWITQILLNNCTNFLRAHQRVSYSFEELENEIDLAKQDEFDGIESAMYVCSATENFEELEKTIFRMHFEDGYAPRDISKMLCINNNTVRCKIHRIKKKLAEETEEDYFTI